MCESKKILILGASDFQLPAIIKAKEMGLVVGVVDMNPEAIGVPYADKFYCVSTIDKDGVLNAAKDFKADGIVTLCTDMPMRALAYACETLGLPGLDYVSAVRSTDKAEMIKAFEVADVEHPGYTVIRKTDINDLSRIGLDYPLITKPTDNSGSRGIMLVESQDELKDAICHYSSHIHSLFPEYMTVQSCFRIPLSFYFSLSETASSSL
jgi:biotin carboxylase